MVGGGNSAGQAAVHLSQQARSVRMVVRRDSLAPTMSRYLLETVRPGVFVAGDVRSESTQRVAGAVGDGALAVRFAHQVLGG